MKSSLRVKLSLSYVLVALISVLLISILTNFFLDKYFLEYVRSNQEHKNKEIVASISQQYSGDGIWNLETVGKIGVNALENGMIIRVIDGSGNVIWDANAHNRGMCRRIVRHMSQNMNAQYPNNTWKYTEVPYPVKYNSSQVGTVAIGTFGPYYLGDNDLLFINTLNKLLVIVGLVSLIFSLLVGSIMARQLSLPISRVISAARSIAQGCFTERITEKSSTKEICDLTYTINNLADTLERLELLRKKMSEDVAHELRTPLATLQSHIEAMIDGIWEPERERLKSCHEEIIRISKMVGDMEKLAKYESENLVLIPESFDVLNLLRRIVCNFEPEFQNKNVEIHVDGNDMDITADKDRFSQVVINIIANALKYTPANGRVDITAASDGDLAVITIKDSGQGIPEEDLPYIFERFYRADKSRNRLTGGSGIGLSIAKAIVEAHGGKVEVHSQVGIGSEFIISIPQKRSQ